jgi:lipopolysaccharide biosynthesis regulator YciM
MSNAHEKISINERINDFFSTHRRKIIICLAGIVVLAAGFIAHSAIDEAFNKQNTAALEEFGRRYETLRFDINEPGREEEVKTLLGDLEKFAKGGRGYAGGRAWSLAAAIHADRKEWAEAGDLWIRAAEAAADTYLEPVSLFQAAVAAEWREDTASAIDLYARCASSKNFPSAARARFSIGRLEESRNNRDAALEAYRGVAASAYAGETVWINLAQSRIIYLETKNQTLQ